MKKCRKCLLEKPVSEFYLVKRGTIVDSRCKSCRSIEAKQKNRKKALAAGRNYREKNIYLPGCKSKACSKCLIEKEISEFSKGGNGKDGHQSHCKICNKEYRDKNKHKLSKQQLDWQKRNRASKSKYQLEWHHSKKSDHDYKAKLACRYMIRRLVRQIGHKKTRKTYDEIGYTHVDLRIHMEGLFADGMSWGNHGEWHIDHIRPVSEFIKEGVSDPSVINALSNLQPLWAADNLRKGDKF